MVCVYCSCKLPNFRQILGARICTAVRTGAKMFVSVLYTLYGRTDCILPLYVSSWLAEE